jgi:hypothetical protein
MPQEGETGVMPSDNVDNDPFFQEVHDAVKNYWHSRDAVAATADFGAHGGDGQRKHQAAKALHQANMATLKGVLEKADKRAGGVDDIQLAKAALVSPQEFRTIREELK